MINKKIYTWTQTYAKKVCIGLLIAACIVSGFGLTVNAEENVDTEIIVTATDDNTHSSDLKYAINTNEDSAFSEDNIFKVKKGEGYIVYVKDLAGNITSKIVNVSDTGKVTTSNNADSKKENTKETSSTVINVTPYDNSNISKGTNSNTDNTSTEASPMGSEGEEKIVKNSYGTTQRVLGDGSVIDATVQTTNDAGTGKEFYTIQTKDEHVYYLIVDHEQNQDNVYFLDTVTEEDLLSLAKEESSDSEKTSALFGSKNEESNKEEVETSESESESTKQIKENESKQSQSAKIILVLIITGAGGGIYYFMKKKKNRKIIDDDDLEDFEAIEDNEEDEWEENSTIEKSEESSDENNDQDNENDEEVNM